MEYNGHKLAYCVSCSKETIHFLVKGEGVNCWACRNILNHEFRREHCSLVQQTSTTDEVRLPSSRQ
jgi:hypothetical protein